MSDATKLPNLTELTYFQWSNPTAPTPTLARAVSTSDTTVYFSAAPKDKDLAVITAPFLMGAKIVTGQYKGYTLLIYCPNGADGTDGLSATGVTVGIAHNGLDYTTQDSDLAVAAPAGSPIFCADTAVLQSLMVSALQGSVATGASNIRIGAESDVDITIYFENGDANPPFIRFNSTNNNIEFSPDGVSTFVPGTAAGSITGRDGITVTSGDIDVDLTDTTVFVSTSSGAGDNGKVIRLESDGFFDLGFMGTGASVTPANLDTLTDGSNADALHTHTAPSISATTAEAIDGSSTPQALAIMGDDYKSIISIAPSGNDLFNVNTGSYNNFGDADTRTQRAQSFTVTDALATTISLESIFVALQKVASPTDNLTIEIQTDDSGEPSGTVVTNGTSNNVTGSGVASTSDLVEFTWSTPPELTSGDTYWAVIKRSTANNGTNYYQILDANGNVYSGNSAVYTASTTSWSTSTTDLQMLMRFKRDYDGDVAKADADDITRGSFIGFTESNVASGESAAVTQDAFQSGFSGLTTGAPYYIDTTAGGLTLTPTISTDFNSPTPVIKVGRALKADTVEINPEFRFAIIDLDFSLVETGAGGQTNDLNVPLICGFPPKEVFIKYQRTNVAGSANDDRFVVKRFIGTTELPEFYIDPISFGSIGSITGSSDAGIIVSSVYSNGVLLRLRETHENEAITDVQIIIRG